MLQLMHTSWEIQQYKLHTDAQHGTLCKTKEARKFLTTERAKSQLSGINSKVPLTSLGAKNTLWKTSYEEQQQLYLLFCSNQPTN